MSIFYYFLDTVVKPRHDTEGVFRSTQQSLLAMTEKIHASKPHVGMTLMTILDLYNNTIYL
ncbi:MAG: hypothetical protein LN567_06325 [Rickettsia endosymbiont of Graphium doson]|nr:hypothetical protein [Rickettsia endosymbiont of Graphium doson]